MPRQSKIKYDPALTLKQNAQKNGVSIDAIKYFVKTRGIDREGDRQDHNLALIKKAKEANPDVSKAEIARLTGLSVKTINKYLPALDGNGDIGFKRARREVKPLVWDEGIPEPTKQGHTLMSKRLMNLPGLFKDVDARDIQHLHDFLFAEPEKPMLFIGNGGMLDHFAGFLYEKNCGVARCITPLELAAMSDETIKQCRALILSSGGENMDIEYAVHKLLEVNPESTGCYANHIGARSFFNDIDPSKRFLFEALFEDSFISVENKFFRDAILYRAITGNRASDIDISLNSGACYRYQLNNSAAKLTPLRKIKHFVVLFDDYSTPAAHDFESVLVETGVASAQVSDYRNYCHGRFLFVGNHTRHATSKHTLTDSDVAVVIFSSPINKTLVKGIRRNALTEETPIILIETPYTDDRAALDLLIKSNVFLADYEEKALGINPCDPVSYNDKKIHKNTPKYSIDFAQLLMARKSKRQNRVEIILPDNVLLGTIAGDMIGKPYERHKNSIKTTDFPLFSKTCKYTDDTVLTIAVMDWLMGDKSLSWEYLEDRFVYYGTRYRCRGKDRCFSNGFMAWLKDDKRERGRVSQSNGAAMRVSPVGWYFNTMEEVENAAEIQAKLTHNHPDAILGAKAAAVAVFLARKGKSKNEIKELMGNRYGFDLSTPIDEYRDEHVWTSDCKESVRAALISFLWSADFEDAIRNAVSLGGDADTIGAITGSIAEAFYGVPEHIKKEVLRRSIPDEFKDVLARFSEQIS